MSEGQFDLEYHPQLGQSRGDVVRECMSIVTETRRCVMFKMNGERFVVTTDGEVLKK